MSAPITATYENITRIDARLIASLINEAYAEGPTVFANGQPVSTWGINRPAQVCGNDTLAVMVKARKAQGKLTTGYTKLGQSVTVEIA